jgi:predicted DNA-binding protein
MATMKGKQIITNVYLDPEVYDALKELSAKTGAPMAFYIRKAVDRTLAENGIKVGKPKTERKKRI